ncbi:hypothetical protein V6N12_030560 [Hibiscus sabdariffa]|uniref:RNase H type-1 domain-containing protein n=1 Tax=Hibiscus sabdariffa TaxID=183260 RepID=A0ABR2BBN4_9ROSI
MGFDNYTQLMDGSSVGFHGGGIPTAACSVGCADALRLLQHRSTKSGSFAILNHLNQLCGKDWTIAFSKVDRHNNEVADRLAKLASVATFDVVTFDEPPSEVIPELNLVL